MKQLNAALVRGLQTDDTRKRFAADGSEVVTSTPDEFARVIRADIQKWTRIVKAAGIRPDS